VDEAKTERPDQLWTAMPFGEPLPDRVVRAILVSRLANFLDGHAAARGLRQDPDCGVHRKGVRVNAQPRSPGLRLPGRARIA
jgi:hypothetical protein